MIQSFSIRNFKSFREATLPLAPLTLLIGANASGKSNAIEALQLLSWLASGNKLGDILYAIREQELSIRGTLSDFAFNGGDMSLGCELIDPLPDTRFGFLISLTVTDAGLRIIGETLTAEGKGFPAHPLYEFVAGEPGIEVRVAGRKRRMPWTDQQAVLAQLTGISLEKEDPWSVRLSQCALLLKTSLQMLYFLNPHPRSMRGYSFPQEVSLQEDGAGLSSVLYHLIKEERRKDEILDFIRALPEQDIRDVSFLETPRGEVMVRLHETFGGREVPREAALLSDGTLRALAIATALLSLGPQSTIVIEEIDNGVHPSRAKKLLADIQRIARERELRVLLTAHNPALLDALPLEAVPNAVACYRDPQEGDSRLLRLQDLETYPELVAQGPLGQLVTRGILDRFLKVPELRDRAKRVEQSLAWLKDFQRSVESR